ncbi:ABC transporter substrate-binding protein [Sporosarcina obsidiansis]|uniref:ABC transporter substrate-binding protein n=1 Tax=Sporosarcina obsidiansis TaxID=2660748 RepID=UPI00129A28B5|nr:ABC transporter substrate-binding protein [Sporosarcina obsidiansis]
MKKLFGKLGFITVLSALVIAGCAGDSESKEADNKEQAGGGTLIYGRGTDTVTLDPHNIVDAESSRISKNVYETLIDYEKEGTDIVPKLATEWNTSEDGKTWTFTLREGVKFHDGTDFDADAVVYNFNRMMDESHPQHQGDFSIFGRTVRSLLEEVKAIDPHTVEFKLNESNSTFLPNIGITTFGIISPTALEKFGEEINQNPVGTGPFKYESWQENDSLTLVKNEEYWIEDIPKLDKVLFKVIPDNSARLTALKNNEIDLMEGLNQTDLPTLEGDENVQLFKRPSANVGYFTFNITKAPFDNVKVRQAISYAIDKQGIIDTFYGPLAVPAKNMMPPVIWGYNDEVTDYNYDLDKAKSLLAEAGFPNGFDTELMVMSTDRVYLPQPQKVAEAVKANLSGIGINVKITTYEWAAYLSKVLNKEHAFAAIGRLSENGDPDNFLYTMLHSNSSSNLSLYKNDEVDELLSLAQQTIDKEERNTIYKKVQELVHEDAPTIPLAHVESAMAGATSVKGYIPHAIGYESLQDVYIQK